MPGHFRDFVRIASDLRRSTQGISRRDARSMAKTIAKLAQTTLQIRSALKKNNYKALDGAIEVHRAALKTIEDAPWVIQVDNPVLLAGKDSFAFALLKRYFNTGARDDLEEAVELFREVINSSSPEYPHHAVYLSNLGAALIELYHRTKIQGYLDEAIAITRGAVEATLPDNPHLTSRLFGLSIALSSKFNVTGRPELLEESIKSAERAVKVAPRNDKDGPDRNSAKSLLSSILLTSFETTGDLGQLNDAVNCARESVVAAAQHPYRADRLLRLGRALEALFGITGQKETADEAIRAYEEAAKVVSSSVDTRIWAARRWGRLAHRLENGSILAMDGYKFAVSLLPLLGWRGLSRSDQEFRLDDGVDLGSEAAACALSGKRVDQAVESLEQGRTIIWSLQLETRGDLAVLETRNPELAARLGAVRTQLEQLNSPTGLGLAETVLDVGNG